MKCKQWGSSYWRCSGRNTRFALNRLSSDFDLIFQHKQICMNLLKLLFFSPQSPYIAAALDAGGSSIMRAVMPFRLNGLTGWDLNLKTDSLRLLRFVLFLFCFKMFFLINTTVFHILWIAIKVMVRWKQYLCVV